MALGRLFGKRRRDEDDDLDDATSAVTPDDDTPDDDTEDDDTAEEGTDSPVDADVDWDALDAEDWRDDGPFDVTEIDSDELDEPDPLRIDLGSLVITGFEGMELRLQIAEDSQQIVSALMIKGDSALEVAAFAAPRSGGLWSELREEIVEATNEAGGSIAQVEGPYGTELRRLLPMVTPDGEQGYQPSRMWVAQGPRWCLRGVLYGQASVTEGLDGPVEPLLDAFRKIIVRRGGDPMAPGDLLPLHLPEGVQPAAG